MAVTVAKPGSIKLVALASLVGTTIEWYDFFLYGTAAALVLNKLFFPTFDPLMGTLAALATYSVGFVARPIGGIVIGHYGDKIGRKSMLVLTLMIMGVATFLIGCLPTYAQIGPWAAVLLVVLRIAQGFGVGGEWGGAVLMAVEHAPPGKRGFYGSWPQIGVPAGLLLANLVFSRFARMPEADFLAWGWRVPFLLSILLVGVGLVIRLAHPRDAGVREDEGNAARSAAADHRGADASTRKRCCSRWARGSRKTARSTSTACSSWSTRRRRWAWIAERGAQRDPARVGARAGGDSALRRALGSRRAPSGLPVRRHLHGGPRLPVVPRARQRIDAAGLDDDRALVPAARTRRCTRRRRRSCRSCSARACVTAARRWARSCRRCWPAGCRRSSPRRCCSYGYGRGALSLYLIGMAAITIVAVIIAAETISHDIERV